MVIDILEITKDPSCWKKAVIAEITKLCKNDGLYFKYSTFDSMIYTSCEEFIPRKYLIFKDKPRLRYSGEVASVYIEKYAQIVHIKGNKPDVIKIATALSDLNITVTLTDTWCADFEFDN